MRNTRSDVKDFNGRINMLVLESLISVKKQKNEGSFRINDTTISAKTRATQYYNKKFDNQKLKELFKKAINRTDYFEGIKRFEIPAVETIIDKDYQNDFTKALESLESKSTSDVIVLSEDVPLAKKINTYIRSNVKKNNGDYVVKLVDDNTLYDFMNYVLNERSASEIIIKNITEYQKMVDLKKLNECSSDSISDYIKSLERQLIIAKMTKLIKDEEEAKR